MNKLGQQFLSFKFCFHKSKIAVVFAVIIKQLQIKVVTNLLQCKYVSLCCSLCKVIDYVFIDKYSKHFKSSNLQFAFQAEHDTVMCTSVVKETVQYYLNKKPSAYACMLDASKAFDKVHFGKLFKLLVDRKMPAIVISLLLNNYTRQNTCTTWNGTKSHTFTALNGVRQGGVLSPLLFNVYFDEMIYKLEKSCIGCKIGTCTHFIGALA